jgi:hypothetical protein
LLYAKAVNQGQRSAPLLSERAVEKLEQVAFADMLLWRAAQVRRRNGMGFGVVDSVWGGGVVGWWSGE